MSIKKLGVAANGGILFKSIQVIEIKIPNLKG